MIKTRWIGWGLAAMAAMVVVVPSAMTGGAKGEKLPEAAAKSLKEAFPKETFAKDGVNNGMYWEVAAGKNGAKNVCVTAEGLIVNVTTRAAETDLSEAASKSVKEAAEAAKISQVLKTEIRAKDSGKRRLEYVPITPFQTNFIVSITKDNKAGELTVSSDGKVLHPLKWTNLNHAAGIAAKDKLVIRVACGNDKGYTDLAGVVWAPDQKYSKDKKWGYAGGQEKTAFRENCVITGTDAPELYLHERYYMDNYRFDVPNGKYTVRVHMCETWEGASKPGQRSFGLKIQDKIVQPVSFDLIKDVGYRKPHISDTKDVEVTDGKLIVHFMDNGKHQHPLVNAVEVIGQ